MSGQEAKIQARHVIEERVCKDQRLLIIQKSSKKHAEMELKGFFFNLTTYSHIKHAKSVNLKQEWKCVNRNQRQVNRNTEKMNDVCLWHLMQVFKQSKTVR